MMLQELPQGVGDSGSHGDVGTFFEQDPNVT